MDIFLTSVAALFIIIGLAGSFVPVAPGPPISYAGLLVLQLTSSHPFGWKFLIIWGLVVIILMVADNVIPAYSTKKFGGSPYGVWGCIAGMIIGLFFSPVGLIVGPLAGAFIGEFIKGKNTDQALRSAWGSFVGFLLSTLLKVIAAGLMAYYFIIKAF